MKALTEQRPDVMFQDVELRGGKQGFDLLVKLPAQGVPLIFVTAHPEQAVRAFETQAVDFLLKPIDLHQLKEILKRIGDSSDAEEVRIFLQYETAMLRDGTRNVLLKVGDIHLLEAGDYNTNLVLVDKSGPMVNGTLKSVLGRINPRCSFKQTGRRRSTLIM